MAALPYQTDPRKSRFSLALLDPNDPSVTGPFAMSREPAVVQGGLLDGWSADYVKAMKRPQAALEGWEQVQWHEDDDRFVAEVLNCTTPEQVEAAMPRKWLPWDASRDVDDRLARVCVLCTAVVNRYIAYEEGGATAARTTTQWREHQRLKEVIEEVLRVLEASIGESLVPAELRDAAFVRQCWERLGEEEQAAIEALLHSAGGQNQ